MKRTEQSKEELTAHHSTTRSKTWRRGMGDRMVDIDWCHAVPGLWT